MRTTIIDTNEAVERGAQLTTAMACLVTLVVGLLLAVVVLALRDQSMQFALRQTQSLALVVSEQTARTLQTVEQELHALEHIGALVGPELRSQQDSTLRDLSYIRAIGWIDAQDRLVFDSATNNHAGTGVLFGPSHPQWSQARNASAHTTTWIAPSQRATDGSWQIVAAHPVYDRKNRYLGMLVASVNPQPFYDLWKGIDLGREGSIVVLRRNGDAMMRNPSLESVMGKNYAFRPLFIDYIPKRPEGAYIDNSVTDGVKRLFYYRIPPSHPDLVIVVGQSVDFILVRWWQWVAIASTAWLVLTSVVLALAIRLRRLWRLNQVTREFTRQQSVHLRELSQGILQAQEAERARIARELHDELGQSLTALKINLQSANRYPEKNTSASFQENMRIVDDTIAQVRSLSLALRPSILDNLGLVAALQWMGKQMAERCGFSFTAQAEPFEQRLSESIETCCFRVAQEALTNVARHAHAKHVWITLHTKDGRLFMEIRDDGVGMDLVSEKNANRSSPSLGVSGMRERTALVRGLLTIESQPGKGCTVTMSCPLETV